MAAVTAKFALMLFSFAKIAKTHLMTEAGAIAAPAKDYRIVLTDAAIHRNIITLATPSV